MSEKTAPKEQIISRIKKLLKHAESAKSIGSLKEAEVFAAKAQELLMEYNVTMMEVAMAAEKDNDQFASWTYGESISYADLSGNRWKFELIDVLTKHNLCRFTFNKYLKTFRVYGNMSNVDTVVWLFNFINIALLRLSKDSYCAIPMDRRFLTTRRAYIQSFLVGAVHGLDKKLQLQREEQARNAKMHDLIVYNAKALETYLQIIVPNIKPGKGFGKTDLGMGYREGYETGKGLTVQPPIKDAPSKKLKRIS
jgi:hypothetical protein